MASDIEIAKFLFQVAQFLLTGGVGIYVYMSRKDTVTNSRITAIENALEKKMDEHIERIVKVETLCDKAPTHEHLSELHNKINNVSDCVSRIEGGIEPQFKALNHSLGIIQSYLLGSGSKP